MQTVILLELSFPDMTFSASPVLIVPSLIVIRNKRSCAVKDLGEPREASRSLRRDNRAFGSLPSPD
jgi:hypothetical protein